MTFASTRCDFRTVDAATSTQQELFAVAAKHPVVLLNAYKWDETTGTQATFLDVFANVNVSTTSNVEFQSAWDHMYSATKTTFGAWVSQLGDPGSVPYVFSWCYKDPECAKRFGATFEIPAELRSLTERFFISAGSEARGIAFHQHERTWAALLAGSKTWVVAYVFSDSELERILF